MTGSKFLLEITNPADFDNQGQQSKANGAQWLEAITNHDFSRSISREAALVTATGTVCKLCPELQSS